MAKEILINQLFAGRYLEEGANIGHEVINLFKDDDGYNNLFITPSGKVKGHDVEYILFVRNVSFRRTVEVIGLAEGLSGITFDEMKQIRYAGVSLDQIFSNNRYHGETDPFSNHVTYRARNFRLPSHRVFITLEGSTFTEDTVLLDSERAVILPQSMREYYSKDTDPVAYNQLKGLINDNDKWEQTNKTEKLISEGAVQNQNPSFLEIIRKEDDENILSNLLAYFFDYSHNGFQRFAANPDLLNIPDFGSSFTVQREAMGRVDLWIESNKDIIVIENKIKSGINGIIGNDFSQLNKYHEKAESEARKAKKKAHYYIFAPDYAKFDLKQFGLEGKYKVVKYSEINNFFVREAATYIADRIFPDFLRGLKRHTLSLPELQFETMRSRLLRKINQLQ